MTEDRRLESIRIPIGNSRRNIDDPWRLGGCEIFAHLWSEIPKDHVDGKDSERRLFEIGFAGINEHQAFLILPPSGAHELGREILSLNRNSSPTRLQEHIADFYLTGLAPAECGLVYREAVGLECPRKLIHFL
jgi:hypothetical protein